MNKNTVNKIKVILLGLNNRFLENREYVNSINFEFKSGTKYFKGEYVFEDEIIVFSFLGSRKYIDKETLFDCILDVAHQYDSLDLNFNERGSGINLYCNDKTVKTNNLTERKDIDKNLKVNREYLISPVDAQSLLKEIGILSKDGKIKNDMIRKYNQIDHFIEVIMPILKEFQNKESITVLDCACGKSYLSFVLNYYIKEVLKKKCDFIGIDISDEVIESSKKIANNLGYKNMLFVNEDLRTYIPDKAIDITISLHACDVATDYALATAIRSDSKAIVVVPCCHKELIEQIKYSEIEPLYKHNIFKTRLNDFLTDSLRCLFLESHGYTVSPLEYISPLDTPKNLMIRGIKNKRTRGNKEEEYEQMKKLFSVKPTMDKYIF
ncbi:MAG: class I SAM-dependent methyltransferase [Filifactoraceae bacterium]